MNTFKILIGIFFLSLCFACTDNEPKDLFDKTPEQRIAEVKDEYKKLLLDAPNGWKTYFGTSKHLGRWLILMKFDEKGMVSLKCDPVDYYYLKGVAFEDPVTYRVDYSHFAELIFESFSQFSAWNEFPVDSNRDGEADQYAGPETQFIFEKYENGKLYMKGKSNIGVGKNESDVMTYIFEKAEAADWDLAPIEKVKKTIAFESTKGKYQQLAYKGNLLGSIFMVDAYSRVVIYSHSDGDNQSVDLLPFYITSNGFTLVNPLTIKGIGTVRDFTINPSDNSIEATNIKDLKVVYSDKEPALKRMAFNTFDKVYLGIEVYHSTGEPIGRNLKKVFDELRPPYAPDKQHLNVIYFARNITKDMGGVAFKYPEELTLIYADSDPSYSGKDLYGSNPTFVRIPVSFETTTDRMWVISSIGSIEEAFMSAYPNEPEYAKQKAKEAMPMLYKLLHEKGWGLYAQGTDTNNPTIQVIDESDAKGSFFTLYPYTQEDVDKKN